MFTAIELREKIGKIITERKTELLKPVDTAASLLCSAIHFPTWVQLSSTSLDTDAVDDDDAAAAADDVDFECRRAERVSKQ